MKRIDPNVLIGERQTPWFPVCYFNVTHDVAATIFTGPPLIQQVDGLGDADYYATEYSCGLRLAFEFVHQSHGVVFAPTPTPQHARRHLKRWASDLINVPLDLQERDRNALIEKFDATHQELDELDRFQVYRMGDDGNAVAIGSPTTRSDAECWVTEFESHVHKQIYWIEDRRAQAKRNA